MTWSLVGQISILAIVITLCLGVIIKEFRGR